MKKHLYGVLASIAVVLPNLILILFPPSDAIPTIKDDAFLTVIEQIGRIGCVFLPAIIGVRKKTISKLDKVLIVMMIGAVITTASIWIAYVFNGRHYGDLLSPVLGIPVPLAVIPSIYFILLAVFMRSYLLGASSVLFFIGHYFISNNAWTHFSK